MKNFVVQFLPRMIIFTSCSHFSVYNLTVNIVMITSIRICLSGIRKLIKARKFPRPPKILARPTVRNFSMIVMCPPKMMKKWFCWPQRNPCYALGLGPLSRSWKKLSEPWFSSTRWYSTEVLDRDAHRAARPLYDVHRTSLTRDRRSNQHCD